MSSRAVDDCRGDLVARAQRGPLSAADRAALIAHLASCESCHLIQQIASDFAEMRAVDRGDEIRLEEMAAIARRAARGVATYARPSRPRWYARAAAVAAGLVLIAGSASATAWLWPRLGLRSSPAVSPLPAQTESVHRAPSKWPPPAAQATAPAPAAPAPVVVVGERQHATVRATRERSPIRATAAELLRQARDAKTDGRGPQAIALYRRLQKEFPASSEALIAAVPLGRLLLDRASPQAALAQFDRYLAGARGGALVPEALYGRAQAQSRLGDRDAERASWRRLLSDYPDSPYSVPARRRLSELL